MEKNIISDCQHGFVPGRSTQTCATDFTAFIYDNLDKKKHVAAIFLDLSKAFDMINHSILLQKLHKLGFSTSAINLLASYLSERKQTVIIDGVSSFDVFMYFGVPQGSILGPLLFLLYINDLASFMKLCKLLLFADDGTLLYAHKNIQTLYACINDDLQCFYQFCQDNHLVINPKKSKAMFFYNRRISNTNHDYHFCLNHQQIEVVTEFKFLGIRIDSLLTFKNQITHVCSKLSSVNYLLHKLRYILPKPDLVMLFNAIGKSHILYCSTVYLNNYHTVLFKRMVSH